MKCNAEISPSSKLKLMKIQLGQFKMLQALS